MWFIRRKHDDQWYAGTTDRKAQFTADKKYAAGFPNEQQAIARLDGLPAHVIYSVETG